LFCLQVASTSDEKLNQPLLQFHEESTPDMPLLAVNFDPALVRLLRETRYFLLLHIEVSCWGEPSRFVTTII
jgi:dynein heavy chain